MKTIMRTLTGIAIVSALIGVVFGYMAIWQPPSHQILRGQLSETATVTLFIALVTAIAASIINDFKIKEK